MDTNSNQVLLFTSQEKLELLPEIGAIPTFDFYAVLCLAIMRLWVMAGDLELAILSFNHRLSFR